MERNLVTGERTDGFPVMIDADIRCTLQVRNQPDPDPSGTTAKIEYTAVTVQANTTQKIEIAAADAPWSSVEKVVLFAKELSVVDRCFRIGGGSVPKLASACTGK